MVPKSLVRIWGVALVLVAWSAAAQAFTASTNVALVPNADGEDTSAGSLPTSNSAFTGITFTDLALADVSAAKLAGKDTVVLNQVCDPINQLSDTQRTAILDFVSAGGKLIIYDSDACGDIPVDYSWLPFPLMTNSPGATGSSGGTLTIVEENALSSNNKPSASFVDTVAIPTDTDAVGDANVMLTKDRHWCGDMDATNVNNVTGFVHAYALFGSGIIIYNGLDTDDMGSATDPGATDGEGNLARVWLLELKLANASTLVCSAPVAGGTHAAPAMGASALGGLFVLLLLSGARLASRRVGLR